MTEQLSRRGTRFELTLWDEGNTLASIAALSEVKLVDTVLSPNATLFDGLLTHSERTLPGPNVSAWKLTCTDWTYYLDYRHISAKYVNQTADYIAKDLLVQGALNTVITTTNVQAGPAIATANFSHATISRALTKLCKLAQGQAISPTTNWSWYVDYARDLHLFDQSLAALATYYLTDSLTDTSANAVHYSRDSFAQIQDATTLRTNAWVRGGNTLSNVWTENWVGNGSQTAFVLSYAPYTTTTDPNYYTPTLMVNGVTKTVALDSGASGQTAQWLMSQAKPGTFVLKNNTDSTPANGVAIVLTYKYQIPILTQVPHPAAQATYKNAATGHDGKFDVIIQDQAIQDINTAIQRGLRELAGYAYHEQRLRVEALEDVACHFHTGQLVNVTNSQVGLTSAPYLIYANQIKGSPGNYRTYTMDLVRVT